MAKLERLTVTMPAEMAAKMRAAVESGEYATTSEIVREALQDWDEYQERRQAKLARLRAMIAEGEKGPFRDGEEVMEELIEKYRTLAENERQKAA
jgi:antitoxin ParD1/3/4